MKQTESQNLEDRQGNFSETSDVPISRALKGLLIRALGDANNMSFRCPLPGCSSLVSPFSYAGIGVDISTLIVCCNRCAKSSNAKLCKTFSMEKERALTVLRHAGCSRTFLCSVCENPQYPIDLISEHWHLGHDKAKSRGGVSYPNRYPVHQECNRDQDRMSLAKVRKAIGLTKYPKILLSEKKAKRGLKKLDFQRVY